MMAVVVHMFDRYTNEIVYSRILTTTETSMMCGDSQSLSPPQLKLYVRLKSGVLLLPLTKMIKAHPWQVFDDMYSAALGIGSPKGSALESIYLACMWGFRPCVDALMHGLSKKLPDYSRNDPIKWLMLLLMISYIHKWAIDIIYLQMVCSDVYDHVNKVYGVIIDIEFVMRQPFVRQRFEEVLVFAQDDSAFVEACDIDGFFSYVRSVLSKIDIGMLLVCSGSRGDTCLSSNTDVSDVCSVSNAAVIDTAAVV